MSRTRFVMAVVVSAFTAAASLATAQTTSGPAVLSPQQQALAAVIADRDATIQSVVDRWRPIMDAKEGTDGWDQELTKFLRAAPAGKLLAATQAVTYDQVGEALFGKWTAPAVVPLAQGDSPANLVQGDLGSNSSDLVFTPVTPCRIIDTRLAGGPLAANTGRQFQVNLADYTVQGGNPATCNIPTSFDVSAVAINVTSTGQSGPGNLRIIQTGGALPSVSLVNYTPGVNIANAAVVRSAIAAGNDIFIYSTNSMTDVVVDIMGYFAAPMATDADNYVVYGTSNVAASVGFDVYSPACPTGYRLSGGGFLADNYSGSVFIGSRPVQGAIASLTSGANLADRYLCQGTNGASAQNIRCFAVCVRVPGR